VGQSRPLVVKVTTAQVTGKQVTVNADHPLSFDRAAKHEDDAHVMIVQR
jgi:hypothetical protein